MSHCQAVGKVFWLAVDAVDYFNIRVIFPRYFIQRILTVIKIRPTDFSEYKTNAYKEQATARALVVNVTQFTLPGQIFKQAVQQAENKREELESKLEDLKKKSQTAGEEVIFLPPFVFVAMIFVYDFFTYHSFQLQF